MTCSGVGLVLASVGRPPHRGVDDVFGLVSDVEQAADLGQGQPDPVAKRRVRFGPAGAGGLVVGGLIVCGVAGGVVGRGVVAVGCGSPFLLRCR